jgi:hypothetical protein
MKQLNTLYLTQFQAVLIANKHLPSTFLTTLVISRVKGLSLSPSLEETLCHCSSRNREFILESLEQKRQASTMKSSEWIKQELDKDKDNIVQVKVCFLHLPR